MEISKMVSERYVEVDSGSMFVRTTERESGKPVTLMIHGLGESGFCFEEAIGISAIGGVVIPDLLGYGRSSAARENDYAFASQVKRLWRLMDSLQIVSFCVVGHSLGGDIGTLMVEDDSTSRIRGFVNIEGNLTPHDLFISTEAFKADQCNDFDRWLHKDFMEDLVLNDWSKSWDSCRRYYDSLRFCRPQAFRANAIEAFVRNQAHPGKIESSTGALFERLKGPKVFCWGSESIKAAETLEFIGSADFANREFDQAFHWPMIDRAESFYRFLSEFVKKLSW